MKCLMHYLNFEAVDSLTTTVGLHFSSLEEIDLTVVSRILSEGAIRHFTVFSRFDRSLPHFVEQI